MIELSAVGAATAMGAGLVSFLSPCVLPLVPGYLSYVAGHSLEELRDRPAMRARAVPLALSFILGFALVFMILGASATALGGALLQWRYELGLVAGVIVTGFGLHLAGITPLALLQHDVRFHHNVRGGRAFGAFVMGLAFAFGWTPCIGPILGAILTLGASTGDVPTGTALLGFYAAGLGVPFLVAALFTDRLLTQLRRLSKFGYRLQQLAGAVLVVMGLLMLTGRLEALSYWLLESFPVLSRLG
jgi:cytochrome c-type biogenesis protein